MRTQPSLTTRVLHLGISISITLQLLVSTFMDKPKPGPAMPLWASLGFDVHEVVGILSLPVLLLWFIWLFVRKGEAEFKELFPWFRRSTVTAWYGSLSHALSAWRSRIMPYSADNERVAHSVHGLGALCALGMALSGFVVWLGLNPQGNLTEWAQLSLSIHRLLANLMWVYWVGHSAMAVWHQSKGESILQQMFSLLPYMNSHAGTRFKN
ncbi:MAG: cytochrome b/b6 domain-containing protein [Candidatus Thiodiazotropha sp.]